MIVEIERDTYRLIRVFGFQDEPGVDTSVVIQKFDLKDTFPEEVLSEAAKMTGLISDAEVMRRIDHRDWVTFTIDGENAQDFDDAVSIRSMKNGGFQLGVHIADVSHYVKPETALDQEAYSRGTSVYFPGLTLPMLPERLSNDICSLRPQKERLTITVLMDFDKKGVLSRSAFYPSVIRTEARMTYDAVFQILQGDPEQQDRNKKIIPDLFVMQKLACLLRENRMKQGSLDFDLPEPELVYHAGILHSVVPGETNEAHQMIEEFMVKANETVAQYLQKNGSMIFRIHPPPAPQDIESLRESLSRFRIDLPSTNQIKSNTLSEIIRVVQEDTMKKYISLQVLKSLRWAEYSDDNKGHYGLGKTVYTHFTSPIRRYPDLMVHRILKQSFKDDVPIEWPLKKLALHCSERERRADEAEKELIEWRIFRFLKKQKLGEEIQGIIVDISKSGFAVELEDYFVEGFVSAMDLHHRFDFRKVAQEWSDRKSGWTFRLGDQVCPQLASVDPVNRRIKMVFPDLGEKG
jgi:ribonuclease R